MIWWIKDRRQGFSDGNILLDVSSKEISITLIKQIENRSVLKYDARKSLYRDMLSAEEMK